MRRAHLLKYSRYSRHVHTIHSSATPWRRSGATSAAALRPQIPTELFLPHHLPVLTEMIANDTLIEPDEFKLNGKQSAAFWRSPEVASDD